MALAMINIDEEFASAHEFLLEHSSLVKGVKPNEETEYLKRFFGL